jgi:hypothetical protein
MSKAEKIIVKNEREAWKLAAEIFGCAYERDAEASQRAGYSIYRGQTDVNCWISDLGNRIELNMADGSTICIWIEPEERLYTAAEVRKIITETKQELEAVEKITEAVKSMDITETADAVLRQMSIRRRELMDKLAEFGL